MADVNELADMLAAARKLVPGAFRATIAAKAALELAEQQQLLATYNVQQLESRMLAAWRELLGPIPQAKTLELRNARYTKSDARV